MNNFLQISETSEGFDYWKKRPYLSDELMASLDHVNLMLVPWENYNQISNVFPSGTSSFVQYLKYKTDSEV